MELYLSLLGTSMFTMGTWILSDAVSLAALDKLFLQFAVWHGPRTNAIRTRGEKFGSRPRCQSEVAPWCEGGASGGTMQLVWGAWAFSPAVFGLWPETFCREPGEPFAPAFTREDQSASRRLERPGRSRSPYFIESFRLGKTDAISTGYGRSLPRNLCAAVKLRKRIRPVLKDRPEH